MQQHPQRDAVTETPSARDTTQKSEVKHTRFFRELFQFALIAIVIVLPIRLFIAQPFIVSGSSMDPTFFNGEYLIVDELTYHFENPERLDVIVFRFPENPSKFFIKRIIGLPGETVSIQNGTVTVTNEEHPEGITLDEPYIKHLSHDSFTVTLADDEYFVLGDNRPSSSDSRVWGPLEKNLIIGRTLLRLLPLTRITTFPGQQE